MDTYRERMVVAAITLLGNSSAVEIAQSTFVHMGNKRLRLILEWLVTEGYVIEIPGKSSRYAKRYTLGKFLPDDVDRPDPIETQKITHILGAIAEVQSYLGLRGLVKQQMQGQKR